MSRRAPICRVGMRFSATNLSKVRREIESVVAASRRESNSLLSTVSSCAQVARSAHNGSEAQPCRSTQPKYLWGVFASLDCDCCLNESLAPGF
jgi:hypothetical protein